MPRQAEPSEAELADLTALADGSLTPERRAEVERRVAGSHELQEALALQRRAVAALSAAASEPAPASLRATVEAQQGAAARGRRRAGAPGHSWRRGGAAPGDAARGSAGEATGARGGSPLARRLALRALPIAAAAAFGVWLASGGSSTAPTIEETAQAALRPPTAAAPGPGERGRLAVAVEGLSFPDWQAFGWRAVGTREARIDGRDATVVHYARGRDRIAYAIVSGDALARADGARSRVYRGISFQLLRIDGRSVAAWRQGGHTCVLVGAVPARRLMGLAGGY